MQSFSHRLAVTAPDQPADTAAQVDRSTETAADVNEDAANAAEAPAERQDVADDVDFDTAIAEVLMTLAADQGRVVDAPLTSDRHAPVEVAGTPARDDATSFGDDGSDIEDADSDDGEPDPEAHLAAEAATFRLLGELERLWHSAA